MRIRRDVSSIPARSAKDTWAAIIDLVSGKGTVDGVQLKAAASAMESIIADEHPASVPIVFKGSGPRLLIYCLFNEEAMEAGLSVDRLNFNPTAGDWRMTVPCDPEDVNWIAKTLKERAPRISVHAADEPPADEDEEQRVAKRFDVDWEVLKNS